MGIHTRLFAVLAAIVLTLSVVGTTSTSVAQDLTSPEASPDASPVAGGGSLTVFRFVCNVEDAEPKIEVLAAERDGCRHRFR